MSKKIEVTYKDIVNLYNEKYKKLQEESAKGIANFIDNEIVKKMLKEAITVMVIKRGTTVIPVKYGENKFTVLNIATIADERELNREVVISTQFVEHIGASHYMVYMPNHPTYTGYLVHESRAHSDIVYDRKELTDV